MVCTHIKELYKYVKEHDLKISAVDLVSVECRKCKEKDSCSSL